MPSQPKYELIFAPEVTHYLDAVHRKFHRLIQQTIEEQLSHTPERKTRNRQPLEQPAPFGATWKLRFGPHNRFRVFYDIHSESLAVQVLAIGIKERNLLLIGGEEFEL